VAAALLNVTATDTTSPSYLTVYPQGTAYPGSSNLNWVAGETVANRVVVPVGTSGEIAVFNNAGSTDVVVDVDGYFTDGSSTPAAASLFSAITPVRVLDTRDTCQTLGPDVSLTQAMAGVGGIASNASAVVTNVTATDTTNPSFFTVYPGGTLPLASDVNWGPGQIVPNLTVAILSNTGAIDVYNRNGSADLVIDAFGYFVPESPAPLVVTTTSLPGATTGVAYSTTLSAYGGTPRTRGRSPPDRCPRG
jgi:serine protease